VEREPTPFRPRPAAEPLQPAAERDPQPARDTRVTPLPVRPEKSTPNDLEIPTFIRRQMD
jgi:hypothetical protein